MRGDLFALIPVSLLNFLCGPNLLYGHLFALMSGSPLPPMSFGYIFFVSPFCIDDLVSTNISLLIPSDISNQMLCTEERTNS